MVNAYAPVKSGGPANFSIVNAAAGLLTFLFIAFFAYLGISQIRPPETVPNDAPLTEFSSGRAMQHVREIAQNPHPMGSAEHGRIRDYILKELTALGLEPETQKTAVVNQFLGPPFPSATVENILARIKGTEGDQPRR
jgi:hypothetical protein